MNDRETITKWLETQYKKDPDQLCQIKLSTFVSYIAGLALMAPVHPLEATATMAQLCAKEFMKNAESTVTH